MVDQAAEAMVKAPEVPPEILEKMRQKGLEFEKQMGIGKQTARA